jgi:subtilisin family serine protease
MLMTKHRFYLDSPSTSSKTGFANGHEDLPFCARDDPSCKDIVDGTDAYGEYWNYDGHGHGTHCSGTVGAIGNNDKGIVGVFNSSADWLLQVGKALSAEGYGSSAGVLAAVENCVLAGAKVISMSLGCDDCYLQQADGEDLSSSHPYVNISLTCEDLFWHCYCTQTFIPTFILTVTF